MQIEISFSSGLNCLSLYSRQRSIEQYKSFQVAVPRQVLLTDLIKDMKKKLHTIPATVRFQVPHGTPFCFQERNPLRKEIRNYFELSFKPNCYRYTLAPLYAHESLPSALEPIDSPEPANLARSPSRSELDELNKSTLSSIRSSKDMDISDISPDVTMSEETTTIQTHTSIVSGNSSERRVHSRNSKRRNAKRSIGSTSSKTSSQEKNNKEPKQVPAKVANNPKVYSLGLKFVQ